jgi:hypothetical protein
MRDIRAPKGWLVIHWFLSDLVIFLPITYAAQEASFALEFKASPHLPSMYRLTKAPPFQDGDRKDSQ